MFATALMYHALAQGDAPAGQDPHYTLALDAFTGQLDCMQRDAQGAGCTRDWLAGTYAGKVLLTFDDGHASNFRMAFPALVERGMRADFFVNPAIVGAPGFATWAELREMAEAGMSIQSHGHDHVYLTTLDERRLRHTLKAARDDIEQHVGTPVTLLAPPGGRMPVNLVEVARECGYSHVLSSRPGRIARVGTTVSATPLPRMAVIASLDVDTLQAWISGDPKAVQREQLRYATLAWAKRLLGDARYEQVRTRAIAFRRGRA